MVVMTASSRTYVEELVIQGQNCLLKKAMGWPPCDRTAPMPVPEASVSTTKRALKLGSVITGDVVMVSLSFWKASFASGDHWNWP